MEDKQKICDLLLPLLKATRAFSDLDDLEYIQDQDCVLLAFANGYVRKVNVAMDSGIAMIRDVIQGAL
nr:MAG TPA: hypothetical protein [Bacteriophage sp.]